MGIQQILLIYVGNVYNLGGLVCHLFIFNFSFFNVVILKLCSIFHSKIEVSHGR